MAATPRYLGPTNVFIPQATNQAIAYIRKPGQFKLMEYCQMVNAPEPIVLYAFLDPDEPAGYYVEEIIEGSTIVQCLASVQYDENELKRQMKAQIDEAIKSDRMKPSEAMRLLDDYERGLREYTYLSF